MAAVRARLIEASGGFWALGGYQIDPLTAFHCCGMKAKPGIALCLCVYMCVYKGIFVGGFFVNGCSESHSQWSLAFGINFHIEYV